MRWDLPLGLGDVEPHGDTDRYREGAVHKGSLERESEQHGWSRVAGISLLPRGGVHSPSGDTQDGVDEEGDWTRSDCASVSPPKYTSSEI